MIGLGRSGAKEDYGGGGGLGMFGRCGMRLKDICAVNIYKTTLVPLTQHPHPPAHGSP